MTTKFLCHVETEVATIFFQNVTYCVYQSIMDYQKKKSRVGTCFYASVADWLLRLGRELAGAEFKQIK